MRWQNGRRPLVFLLDGLNEVPQAYKASCSQAVQTFLEHSPPLHRCVITFRPGGDLEATSSRSAENHRLQVADILKFGPQQVSEYLKAQCRTELRSRISGRLEDLASNPFLLWAITLTLGRISGEGRENRGSLFAALIDGYVFEDREAIKPGYRATDYNYTFVKKPVLAQLALKMTQDGVTAVKDGPELRQQGSPWLEALEVERPRLGLPLKAGIFIAEDYSPLSLLYETVSNGVRVQDGSAFALCTSAFRNTSRLWQVVLSPASTGRCCCAGGIQRNRLRYLEQVPKITTCWGYTGIQINTPFFSNSLH